MYVFYHNCAYKPRIVIKKEKLGSLRTKYQAYLEERERDRERESRIKRMEKIKKISLKKLLLTL